MLALGVFFEAKASTLPSIRQFTTISGINGPNALLMSGKLSFHHKISYRNESCYDNNKSCYPYLTGNQLSLYTEMSTVENTSTNVVASAIAIPFTSVTVTARAGQRPSSCFEYRIDFPDTFYIFLL
jgi:hypothetical protein